MPVVDVARDTLDYAGIVLSLLVLSVAAYQVRLLRDTVAATQKAADAANKSADAATTTATFTAAQKRISDRQLRLLYAPCFELRPPKTASFDIDQDDPTIQVVWMILNTGAAPIHFRGIKSTFVTTNTNIDVEEQSTRSTKIGVNRALIHTMRGHSLTPENRAAYKDGRLFLDIDMTLEIFDPTTDTVSHYRRQRKIMCGVGNNLADIVRAIDSEAESDPGDNLEKGQPKDQPQRENTGL